jgi:putative aldouronate transport system permease protein
MIYPFWEIIRISFSTPAEAARLSFSLWPKETSLSAYTQVIGNSYIWSGYKNTIFRILLGLSIQMILMILTAYPLSKKKLPFRNGVTGLIVFTMFFSGGLIPTYLLIKNIGIIDSIWALVLPGAIPTFSMLIVRNYFMGIPEALEEAAKIDGAGTVKTLTHIILPLSMPILMTVGLWGLVGHWNAWFDCLIYISDPDKYVLQTILRKIIIDSAPQFAEFTVTEGSETMPSAEVVKAATIIVSTLPILAIYPFIQKYFVKGIMLGSLKG